MGRQIAVQADSLAASHCEMIRLRQRTYAIMEKRRLVDQVIVQSLRMQATGQVQVGAKSVL